MTPLKLNLGAADRHIEGFVSVDKDPPEDGNVWRRPPSMVLGSDSYGRQRELFSETKFARVDLTMRWPWADSSVDEIIAYDVIEHLPNRIYTMNEMWRVMKHGAIANIEVPNASKGAGFFQDPTHVSPWCMNSFQYYQNGSFAVQRLAKSYGINARFNILKIWETNWQDMYEMTWKIHVILEAVK
jgi:hypothetical protein